MYTDLIVAVVGVHEAQELVANRRVNKHVYPREVETILGACIVAICQVDAHPPSSVSFLHQDYIRDLVRIGGLLDKVCF